MDSVVTVAIGKADIVNANIDLYLTNGRLTAEEYEDIMGMLNPQTEEAGG